MTPKQREMLLAFDQDGEATDYADFCDAGTLAWRNRERVIDALMRKGLLSPEDITEAGRRALYGSNPPPRTYGALALERKRVD